MTFWKYKDTSLNYPFRSSDKPRRSLSYRHSNADIDKLNPLSSLTASERNKRIDQMISNYALFKETKILGQTRTRQNWMSHKEQGRFSGKMGMNNNFTQRKTHQLKQLKQKRSSLLETIRSTSAWQIPTTRPRRATMKRG